MRSAPMGAGVTSEQIGLFVLLAVMFALLIWGRWRYDLVAFSALVVALVTGIGKTAVSKHVRRAQELGLDWSRVCPTPRH